MAICRRCEETYRDSALTEYAKTKYPTLCGKCIFEEIDMRTEAEVAQDCLDGAGIVDYIPCDSYDEDPDE